MIDVDSAGNTFGGSDKKLLTSDEIQKMHATANNVDDWLKTLGEIKASRGSQTPQDMHKVITEQGIFDDVRWEENA